MKKRKLLSVILSAVMVLALTACGGSGSGSGTAAPAANSGAAAPAANAGDNAAAPAASSKPIVVNVNEPGNSLVSLEFYKYSLHPEWQYAEMVYDALLEASYDGDFKPGLCQSYEMSDDGLTATLHLAENVKFQDGTVCDADDVVCTLNYLAENKETLAMISAVWANLGSAEKIDQNTVKVNLTKASHVFDIALGYSFIFSDEDFAAHGDKMWVDGVVNGTGPWKYVEWIDGQYIKFNRNDDYWQGVSTNIDEISIWYISEKSTAVSSMISGDIDACGSLDNDLVAMLQGDDSVEVYTAVLDSLSYLQFKCGPGDAFEDINLRKAAMHAINMESLINLYGGGQVLGCAATPGNAGYCEDLTPYEYNPEKAKEYLAQSNYDGRELSFYSWASYTNELTSVASDLGKIGINVKICPVDSAEFSSVRANGGYDFFYGGVATWDGDLMTQYMTPRILNDCHSSGWVNEEVNQWLRDADVIINADERAVLLEKVVRTMYENYGPICGTVMKQSHSAVRKGLEGINFMKGGCMFFKRCTVDTSVWNQ